MSHHTVYEKRPCTTCRKRRELLAERGIEATYVEHHDVGMLGRPIERVLEIV